MRIEGKNYSVTRTRLVLAGLTCFETFLIFRFNASQLSLDKSFEPGGRGRPDLGPRGALRRAGPVTGRGSGSSARSGRTEVSGIKN